jgi:phosphomannomutase
LAVGRDGRLSGPALSAALIRGLMEVGVSVIDVGMVTTPMLYFAASTLCASGIQVTGSHNPKDYNGFKMVLAGRAIYGDEIQALRQLMTADQWTLPQRSGTLQLVNVSAPYRDRIVQDARLSRPMKVVVDCGNGVAGASAPAIFRALGCEVIELFSEVDGNFPTTIRTRASLKTCAIWCMPFRPPMQNWAWPLTATATAWASSPKTARPSTPTAR